MEKDKKKQENKEESRIIGICGFCNEPIYHDEGWEELYYSRPTLLEKEYKKGPLHNKCRLPALKRLVPELIQDINALSWIVEGIAKEEKETEEKKEKSHKKRGEIL